jgi:hypothetical protein
VIGGGDRVVMEFTELYISFVGISAAFWDEDWWSVLQLHLTVLGDITTLWACSHFALTNGRSERRIRHTNSSKMD